LNFEYSGALFSDLPAVLFTHFHTDHSADFPGLVKGSYFRGRSEAVAIRAAVIGQSEARACTGNQR